jgi:hypothetical protein
MKLKYTKASSTVRSLAIHWNPKDKADRKLVRASVKAAMAQGYWYNIDAVHDMYAAEGKARKLPSDRYLMHHDHLIMDDVVMMVVDSEDLASIFDYLATLGACPMLYTVMDSSKREKKPVRKFKFLIGGVTRPALWAMHTNVLQAAIDAVFLWDQKGRPV